MFNMRNHLAGMLANAATLKVGNKKYSGQFYTSPDCYFDLNNETPFPTKMDIKANPDMTIEMDFGGKKYTVNLDDNINYTSYAKIQGAPLRLRLKIWS